MSNQHHHHHHHHYMHSPMKALTSATGNRNSLPDSAKLAATSTKAHTARQMTRNHHVWLAA